MGVIAKEQGIWNKFNLFAEFPRSSIRIAVGDIPYLAVGTPMFVN
jgi:hypothetical protein